MVRMTYSVPTVLKPLEKSTWVKRTSSSIVKSLMSSTMRGAMEAFRQRLEAKGGIQRVWANPGLLGRPSAP
eukprot:scaffold77026_cov54-Phaeocystis_antarctica.AAC.1